jgi:hypothetical protein
VLFFAVFAVSAGNLQRGTSFARRNPGVSAIWQTKEQQIPGCSASY